MLKDSRFKSYILGFILSLVFTFVAYGLVLAHINSGHLALPHEILIPAIIILAIAQLLIQLIFFLHLGHEKGARWKLAVLLSTVGIILILVIGSLWIMGNLNYHMSPAAMDKYLIHEEGIKK